MVNQSHSTDRRTVVTLLKAGNFPAAADLARRLTEAAPAEAEHWSLCAAAEQGLGRLSAARAAAGRACDLAPRLARAWLNLARICGEAGDLPAALAALHQCVAIEPRNKDAHLLLARAHLDSGAAAAAIPHLGAARAENPTWLAAADHAKQNGDFAGAETILAAHLARQPKAVESWRLRAGIALALGEPDRAAAHYAEAARLAPHDAQTASHRLLCLQYSAQIDRDGLDAAHRAWGDRFAPRPPPRPGLIRTPGSRLRVGFVSSDFRQHAVGFFLLPVLRARTAGAFAAIGYSMVRHPDRFTAGFAQACESWQAVAALDDAALAAQIRADGIDLLIDLNGHTNRNRLPVFARRPAPVQASWLDYVGTTGMTAMDYLIGDAIHTPLAEQPRYRETLVQMPDGYICWAPPADFPVPAPRPAPGTEQPVTFGSTNSLYKLSDPCLAAWGEILAAVPGSRLHIAAPELSFAETERRFRLRLAARGIDAARVTLAGGGPQPVYLENYRRIDVLLDSFPYSGGLTSCEALWLGVPVVTFPGDRFCARHSTGHLTNIGATELIAEGPAGYVELAVTLGRDPARLAALRAGLRGRMAAAPLTDPARFAADLNHLFEGLCA